MVCAKNSAPLSGVVSKVSAGAMEVMDVYACASMPRTLKMASDDGWNIVGTWRITFSTFILVFSMGTHTLSQYTSKHAVICDV